MKCQLTVLASDRCRRWEVDDWTLLVVTAALAAEPDAMDELAAAVKRYQPSSTWWASGVDVASDEWDVAIADSWSVIDLVGRTFIVGGDCELPEPLGCYEPGDGETVEGFPIVWLATPADWMFRRAGDDWCDDWCDDWRDEMIRRRDAVRQRPRLDSREVLYGPPLLRFIVNRAISEVGDGEDDGGDPVCWIRNTHARWLLEPRDDLAGRSPRQILLADRERLDRDLEHRAQQWTRQGHAPPALREDCLAFRYGGFGTAEVVLYFDLVRRLLQQVWDELHEQPAATRRALMERLATGRDQWFITPDSHGARLTPQELIQSERKRLPLTSACDRDDDDCPQCQAVAAGDLGLGLLIHDDHRLELEDEFAFSLIPTRREWEAEQRDYEAFAAELDRWREAERSFARGPA